MPMQPIDMPAPFGGVNEVIPTIALQPPFCESMLNFNVSDAGVSLRNGDSKFTKITPANVSTGLMITSHSATKGVAVANNTVSSTIEFYNIDSGALIFTSAAHGIVPIISVYFNQRTFFFPINYSLGGYEPGWNYDGTNVVINGFTDPLGGNLKFIGGNVYNNRMYLIREATAQYLYTPIGAITGALATVDLTYTVSENCSISSIASITVADNVSNVSYQAFIMSTGEVLFYSGSYPDAADWQLVGKAKVGQPLYAGSTIKYQGDTLLMCDSGVISLRDLFLKGSEDAASLTVNARIQRSWTSLVQGIRKLFSVPSGPILITLFPLYIRGIYDDKNDRIVISFPFYINSSGTVTPGSYFFVFYNQIQSWFFHRSFGGVNSQSIIDICKYKNKVLMLVADGASNNGSGTHLMVYEKEGATGFTDTKSDDSGEVGYDFSVKSAPINNDKNYASYSPQVVSYARTQAKLVGYTQRVSGMDVILQTDLQAQTYYQLIRDFGVTSTTPQLSPSTQTGLDKPFINMGIEGTYVQYKIYGTTTTGKTVGLDLYGTNIWVEQGTSPR